MATFENAIGTILEHEGGFVNHPNDPGGATNFGISLRFLADYPEVGDFNQDGVVDVQDIANMDVEQAMLIYRMFWWDKFKYGRINDQTIATKVFDFSVNMGASRAHKLLQAALNNAFGLNLDVDGVLGNASIAAINACMDGDDEQRLLETYCMEAWGFYQRLIANNPKFKAFEKGWKRRAFSVGQANSVNG